MHCPGQMQGHSFVYSACVTETQSGKVKTYTGLTIRTFKTIFNEHNIDMNNPGGRTKSKVSAHK